MDKERHEHGAQTILLASTAALAFSTVLWLPGTLSPLCCGAILFAGLLSCIPIAIYTGVWVDSVPTRSWRAVLQMILFGGMSLFALHLIVPEIIKDLRERIGH
jgi:hypothetical protein